MLLAARCLVKLFRVSGGYVLCTSFMFFLNSFLMILLLQETYPVLSVLLLLLLGSLYQTVKLPTLMERCTLSSLSTVTCMCSYLGNINVLFWKARDSVVTRTGWRARNTMYFPICVRAMLAAGQGGDGRRQRRHVCSPAPHLLSHRNSSFMRKHVWVHTHGFPHPFTKSIVLRNDGYAYLAFQIRAGFHTQPNPGRVVRCWRARFKVGIISCCWTHFRDYWSENIMSNDQILIGSVLMDIAFSTLSVV